MGAAILDQALSALGLHETQSSLFADVHRTEAARELIGVYVRYSQAEKAVDLIEQLAAFHADGATWPVGHDAFCGEKPKAICLVCGNLACPDFSALLASPSAFPYSQLAELPSPQPTPNPASVDAGTARIGDHQSRCADRLGMCHRKHAAAAASF